MSPSGLQICLNSYRGGCPIHGVVCARREAKSSGRRYILNPFTRLMEMNPVSYRKHVRAPLMGRKLHKGSTAFICCVRFKDKECVSGRHREIQVRNETMPLEPRCSCPATFRARSACCRDDRPSTPLRPSHYLGGNPDAIESLPIRIYWRD